MCLAYTDAFLVEIVLYDYTESASCIIPVEIY